MKALSYVCFGIAGFFAVVPAPGFFASGEFPVTGGLELVGIPVALGVVLLVLSPRFTSRVPSPVRIIGFAGGVALLLGGLMSAQFVEEYGGGTSFAVQESGGTASVYVVAIAALGLGWHRDRDTGRAPADRAPTVTKSDGGPGG